MHPELGLILSTILREDGLKPHLHRCNGTLLGGGDSLLHGTHVSGQGGLVPHS